MDEIALLVKYGYEAAPSTFDLTPYIAHGLISTDTALQVTMTGADGHVIKSSLPFSDVVDLSDREHFRFHRANPHSGLFISRPVVGRISGKLSVQGTRRINRPDGSFGGVVVVSESPAYLTDGFYNSAALGDNGMIAVISPQGFVMSRRAGNARSTAGDSLPQAYARFLKTTSGPLIDPFDHVARLVASRSLDRYGLAVIAGLSVDEALNDYFKMRRVYLTMAVVISALLLGFSSWVMALVLKLMKSREELKRLSEVDGLTGLLNRGKVMDVLQRSVAAPHSAGKVAAVFIDLNDFKQLNDRYGHRFGDEALTRIAERLLTAVGSRGALGRVGGDEFLVAISTTNAQQVANEIVLEIVNALNVTIMLQGHSVSVRASIGVAVLEPNETAADLVLKADLAMYEAKEKGRRGATTWRAYSGAANGSAEGCAV
jgi:diguanylate cyclase (GGDEF)-like protein